LWLGLFLRVERKLEGSCEKEEPFELGLVEISVGNVVQHMLVEAHMWEQEHIEAQA
jgi:hypothetical protein